MAVDAFLPRVLSEEEIEDDAHDGHEKQYQQPGHGLGRLPVVEQYGYHHGDVDEDVDHDEGPV